MATYSSRLRLTLPAIGEYTNTWGAVANDGITALVDDSISGTSAITIAGTDYTLTSVNGSTDEARRMFIVATGTPGAARNVICPAVTKLYSITNNTTGGFALILKTSAGTGISVPNGATMLLKCDGTNVVQAASTFTDVAYTGTLTGGTGVVNLGSGQFYKDASGNLGVGTATPGAKLHTQISTPAASPTWNSAVDSIVSSSASNNVMQLHAGATGGTLGYAFAVASTRSIGSLAYDTTSNAMVFTVNASERMRLDASGNLLVGTATNTENYKQNLQFSGASTNGLLVKNTSSTGASLHFAIVDSAQSLNDTSSSASYQDNLAGRWALRKNGGLANFSANDVNISDVRTKTDIQPATSYLDKICAIPVKTFLYKDQTDTERNLGVIAQDVDAVAPELIDHSGFGETPEGESPYLSVYQTDLQYALMKCIQEQQALITDLRARVAALEAA